MKYFPCIFLVLITMIVSGCNRLGAQNNNGAGAKNNVEMLENNSNSYDVVDESSLEIGLKDKHIISIIKDITTDKDLTIEGDFIKTDTKVDGKKSETGRVLEIDKVILKAPKLTIKSKNTTIRGGTFEGDIYVGANGFSIQGCKIQGNIYFLDEQFKNSFKAYDGTEISGEIQVK